MKDRTFKIIVIILAMLMVCLSISGIFFTILGLDAFSHELWGNNLSGKFQVLLPLKIMALIFFYIPMALASLGLFRLKLWGWKVAIFATILHITSILIDMIFMPTISRTLTMMTARNDQLILRMHGMQFNALENSGLLFSLGILLFLVYPKTLKYFTVKNPLIFMARASYVAVALRLLTLAIAYFMLNSLTAS